MNSPGKNTVNVLRKPELTVYNEQLCNRHVSHTHHKSTRVLFSFRTKGLQPKTMKRPYSSTRNKQLVSEIMNFLDQQKEEEDPSLFQKMLSTWVLWGLWVLWALVMMSAQPNAKMVNDRITCNVYHEWMRSSTLSNSMTLVDSWCRFQHQEFNKWQPIKIQITLEWTDLIHELRRPQIEM